MIRYLFRHEILSVNCGSFSLFILIRFFFSTFLIIIILMSQQQKQQLNDCHQTVGDTSTGETEEAVTHLTFLHPPAGNASKHVTVASSQSTPPVLRNLSSILLS